MSKRRAETRGPNAVIIFAGQRSIEQGERFDPDFGWRRNRQRRRAGMVCGDADDVQLDYEMGRLQMVERRAAEKFKMKAGNEIGSEKRVSVLVRA